MPDAPRKRRQFRLRYLLLIAPFIGLCFPQMYARTEPAIGGFPFFYWYQFAWVVVASVLLMIYYKLVTRSS